MGLLVAFSLACSDASNDSSDEGTGASGLDAGRNSDTGAQPDMTFSAADDATSLAEPDSEPLDAGLDANRADMAEEGNSPPLGGMLPDSGSDMPPGGEGGRGGEPGNGTDGNSCESGVPTQIHLTDGDGVRAPLLSIELRTPEDGGGDFTLGLQADAWADATEIEIEVILAGELIAQRRFSGIVPMCQDDGWWQLNDLRLSPLPSVEVNEVFDVELQVQGRASFDMGGGEVRFEGSIRLE